MGCLSSKILTRSGSFHERLKQKLQTSGHKGYLLEELVTSRNGGDHQLLALVCTANSVSKKFHSNSFTSDMKTSEEESMKPAETINTWELMEGLEEDEEEKQHTLSGPKGSVDITRRSKSFHLSSDQELRPGEHGSLVRSSSFHTVQEYDVLLLMNQQTSKSEISETGAADVLVSFSGDKGIRRKTMAMELTSLKIPTTVEFPVVASLGEQMEVYGGEAYATPKFGSFGLQVSTKRSKCIESESGESLFDPELVSAFDQDMQQLKLEEEFVLQQIAEDLEEKKDDDLSAQLHE